MPADGQLFANGFGSGRSFIFDLSKPSAPRLAKQFGNMGALMHPHSFWQLPNGHLLATFQMQHDSLGMAPGGLVELTPRGEMVRSTSSDYAGVDRRIRPYSSAILPDIDRVVVTTTDMDDSDTTQALQLWRLSDLSVLHTIQLPNGPRCSRGARQMLASASRSSECALLALYCLRPPETAISLGIGETSTRRTCDTTPRPSRIR